MEGVQNRKVKKAALHNLGCKVNSYELEAVRQLLETAGYEMVPFAPGADLYVINTCTVTNIADRKSRQMLHRAKKMNPDAVVVAMGCYAQIAGAELEKDPAIDLVVGNNQRGKLLFLLNEYEKSGEKKNALIDIGATREYENLSIDRTESHTRAFLKVQDGCNQFCSYCIIPYARGRVRSRASDDVLAEVERLAASGTREVVITGIHVCSYGTDFGEKDALLHLLSRINETDGIDRIRLGSLEPAAITRETAAAMAKLEKLCPHFHLSLQSGCAKTLRRMNRGYTPEEYSEIVENLRACFCDPAITTDIITGFPGETDQDFEESRAFVEKTGFFETHIFPYSRREGTRAASFPDQITERVKKERAQVLLDLNRRKQREYLERQLGKETEVLIEEPAGDNASGRIRELLAASTQAADSRMEEESVWWTGHTPNYCEVLVPDRLVGSPNQIVRVVPRIVLDGKLLG